MLGCGPGCDGSCGCAAKRAGMGFAGRPGATGLRRAVAVAAPQAVPRLTQVLDAAPMVAPPVRMGGFGGPPVAVETGAKAIDAFLPGVGDAIANLIFSEVKPIPAPTVGQEQMQRVVAGLAAQGIDVPPSISGLPADTSVWDAFGPQHRTVVIGAAAVLGGLLALKALRRR